MTLRIVAVFLCGLLLLGGLGSLEILVISYLHGSPGYLVLLSIFGFMAVSGIIFITLFVNFANKIERWIERK